MKSPLAILALPVFIYCSSKPEQKQAATADSTSATSTGFDANNYASYSDINNYLVTETEASGIQEVDSTCALVVIPTEEQVAKMEKEYGEDFATIADDASFYQAEALSRFDSTDIKVSFVKSRYIKLKGQNHSWLIDVRKEGAPEWNVILFNTRKSPEIVSSIDVTYDKIYDYYIR